MNMKSCLKFVFTSKLIKIENYLVTFSQINEKIIAHKTQ